MILITKYSVEMYSILIILTSLGFLNINSKLIKKVIILLFIGLNLFYLLNADDAAPKRTRTEGHLAVVELLKNSKLKNDDFVLLTYYGADKFQKYLDNSTKYNFYSINKFNFNYILFDDEDYFDVIKSGKEDYKDFFYEFPNYALVKYTFSHFLSKMKKGDRIGVIILNNVSFISSHNMKIILNDEKKYNNTPFVFLIFSAIKNNMLNILKQNLTLDSMSQAGDWTLYVFVKTH